MNNLEVDYVKLINNIIWNGEVRQTRNAITTSIFGETLRFNDLEEGRFPILRGRKLFWEGVVGELAAFLKGPKTVEDFRQAGCNYWDAWGDEQGNINVDYGKSWQDFNGHNQLKAVVDSLKNNPYGRRHLISGWRPDRLNELSLPCCHYAYQWYVTTSGHLEMIWIQRSVDVMVGLPSDIILAAVWNILMAQTVGLKPGKITMQLGDTHVYESHETKLASYFKQANLVSLQEEKPTWVLAEEATVFNFEPSMFKVISYNPHPAVKFKLEV